MRLGEKTTSQAGPPRFPETHRLCDTPSRRSVDVWPLPRPCLPVSRQPGDEAGGTVLLTKKLAFWVPEPRAAVARRAREEVLAHDVGEKGEGDFAGLHYRDDFTKKKGRLAHERDVSPVHNVCPESQGEEGAFAWASRLNVVGRQ